MALGQNVGSNSNGRFRGIVGFLLFFKIKLPEDVNVRNRKERIEAKLFKHLGYKGTERVGKGSGGVLI